MSTKKPAALTAGRPSAAKPRPTLADLADKAATVRVNFDLDRETHTKLKIRAAQSGRSIAEILRELINSIDERSK